MAKQFSHKRRIKLIKPGLQLRLVGIFFGLSCLGALIQSMYLGLRLSALAASIPEGGSYLLATLPGLPIQIFLVSFFMLLPLTMAVGVVCTFRIAGPVYHFEKFLREVAAGSETEICRLRKGDQLNQLCALINEATQDARSHNAEALETASAPDAEGVAA